MKALLASILLLAASAASAADNPKVVLDTTMGDIVLELYPAKAPITVENFLTYVRNGFYDGTIFHRVIPGFMIQGGGLTADMERKATRDPIRNEANNGLKNKRGTIAMARMTAPHSATSQFFINLVDNPSLNHVSSLTGRTWGYAVFGHVVEGMDVVDAIARVKTHAVGGRRNVPVEPVVIEHAEIIAGADDAEAPADGKQRDKEAGKAGQ